MNVKLSEAQKKIKISNAKSIAEIMQRILKRENKLGRSQEHFWVCGLDNVGKILFIELIALGRQNRVSTNPPDVFRMAIHKLAMKLILIHNHPSGQLHPSKADEAFTDRILKVGEIINVDVIEHLIISEKDYFSFAEYGILEILRKLDTWRLVEKETAEVQQMKRELEKREIERNANIKVAKYLKATGIDEAVIKKATGLSLALIRKV